MNGKVSVIGEYFNYKCFTVEKSVAPFGDFCTWFVLANLNNKIIIGFLTIVSRVD